MKQDIGQKILGTCKAGAVRSRGLRRLASGRWIRDLSQLLRVGCGSARVSPWNSLGLFVVIGLAMAGSGCAASGPDTVEVVQRDGGWVLLRDGKPYTIRGAGGRHHLELLAEAGGNSIRTWDAKNIDDLLDQAHALGLSVTVGIWLEHERHGYDYDDPQVRETQLEKVRTSVLKYRDHPALLMWALGNEVELMGDEAKAFRAVEEAAAIAKELDPRHPRMAVVAEIGSDKAKRLREACRSIDVLGVNAYGGAASVPKRLTAQGWTGPYVITEFGPVGPWETGHTPWGAAFEPSSAEKASMYRRTQEQAVKAEMPGRCLGSYAFLWGHKQETTATWFGMFLDSGERTPTVDVMQEMWTGRPPENRAPLVGAMQIDLTALTARPGQEFHASVPVENEPEDQVRVVWVVRGESTDRKSGGDAEEGTPDIPGLIMDATETTATVRAPSEPGAYRLYVYIYDDRGGAGTANLPFLVTSDAVE